MASIIFVQNIYYEYLGVMYLSAVLKKAGHQVECIIKDSNESDEQFAARILAVSPQAVGFSCMSGNIKWASGIASILKKKSKLFTVFGGPHPTFFPEIIEEESVDVVCRGEGEGALLDIMNSLERGQDISGVQNCWVKKDSRVIKNDLRPFIKELDVLPFCDRSVYEKYKILNGSQGVFIAGRGCPFQCSFCFNHALKELYKGKGDYVRLRRPANVIAEIRQEKENRRLKTVLMIDDTFVFNKKWVIEFCQLYSKFIKLPLVCLVRADFCDRETIQSLAAAGCRRVFMGVETGNEEMRNLILKKMITDNQICETAELLHENRIKFRTYNMVGLPGESLDDAFKTVNLNIKIKADYPWCSLFYPYYGTELAEYSQAQGFLDSGAEANSRTSFFKTTILSLKHKNEIINLQRLFYFIVKFPWLMPFIKIAIKLPANKLFDFIFLLSYGFSFWKSQMISFGELVRLGRKNVNTLLG